MSLSFVSAPLLPGDHASGGIAATVFAGCLHSHAVRPSR